MSDVQAIQIPVPAAVEYPDSDGKPMADNDAQRKSMFYAVGVLEDHFEDDDEVYVAGDLLIYYEKGNKEAAVAPDAFVVRGVRSEERNTYLLWEEGKAPDFVLEVTSPSTWRQDQGRKRRLYERLGVAEYWQYDPTEKYLQPVLQGLVLVEGEYEPIAWWETAAGLPAAASEVLGLELHVTADRLRYWDPATEQYLLRRAEEVKARAVAEARADTAEARADTAEARADTAEARADTAEARADTAEARADRETEARAEAEAAQAAEKARADAAAAANAALAAQVAELKALLNRKPV